MLLLTNGSLTYIQKKKKDMLSNRINNYHDPLIKNQFIIL